MKKFSISLRQLLTVSIIVIWFAGSFIAAHYLVQHTAHLWAHS